MKLQKTILSKNNKLIITPLRENGIDKKRIIEKFSNKFHKNLQKTKKNINNLEKMKTYRSTLSQINRKGIEELLFKEEIKISKFLVILLNSSQLRN